jgi:hypothetical protein
MPLGLSKRSIDLPSIPSTPPTPEERRLNNILMFIGLIALGYFAFFYDKNKKKNYFENVSPNLRETRERFFRVRPEDRIRMFKELSPKDQDSLFKNLTEMERHRMFRGMPPSEIRRTIDMLPKNQKILLEKEFEKFMSRN